MEKLLSEYLETLAAVHEEEKRRAEVMKTPAYQSLVAQIASLSGEQTELLDAVPDSTDENVMDKAELIRFMNDNQIWELDGFAVKTRVSKSVNTTKVLHALDGDLDQFFLLSNVTQKALTEYGKQHAGLKKPFRECVEIDSESVTDIIPQ